MVGLIEAQFGRHDAKERVSLINATYLKSPLMIAFSLKPSPQSVTLF